MKKEELDKTDTIKNTEIESVKKECQNITIQLEKNCPSCNKVTVFKNERSWKKSIDLNLVCKKCINRGRVRSKEYIEKMRLSKCKLDSSILHRVCPSCLKLITYNHVRYRRFADKNNKVCFDCSCVKRRLTINYFRECGKCKVKIKCRKSRINDKNFCRKCSDQRLIGVPLKEETKHKLRLSFINRMVRTGQFYHPAYNERACNLLDEYGKYNGFSLRHALNGGEFYIDSLNVWVDGYDSNLNTVVEIDERKHFDSKGNLKEKDIIRMNKIIKFLKCRFIRIRESDGKVYMDLRGIEYNKIGN